MDCPYYNYRKSSWGWHGGEDANQWCGHPKADGLNCDTDKCPREREEIAADMIYDLLREDVY